MESNWRFLAWEIGWPNLPIDMFGWSVFTTGFSLGIGRQPLGANCQLWAFITDSSGATVAMFSLGFFPKTGFPYGFFVLPDH